MIAFPRALMFSLVIATLPGMATAADEVVVSTARGTRLPTPAERAEAAARVLAAPVPAVTRTPSIAALAYTPAVKRLDPGLSDEAQGANDDAQPAKRHIHGQVSVSIGTNGYRSAYVSSLIPVGDTGLLGIALGQTDYGKNSYYDGYGYGYGRGYGWRRGGTSQSVALSLDMNGDDRRLLDASENCAPGFYDGGRYIEPLWLTRMRGYRDCRAADAGDALGQ